MKIPLVDLKAQYDSIKPEIDEAIQWCIDNSRFIGGKPIENFEANFAKACSARFAVGVSSGTSALQLSLKAYGIGPGDEVIVPTHTFIATSEAVSFVGARTVLVDVDKDTYNIDVERARKAITGKTRAIIPVHIYGQPADMQQIMELAEEKDLTVIEDAAQAHLAEYKGRRLPYGETACYSFFPGKNLGAYGDAGAVVTNDEDIALKIRMLRDHGREPGHKYDSTIEGYGERLDSIQASILDAKLRHLEAWTEARRKNVRLYNDLLKGMVVVPYEAPDRKHVYHLYVIRTKKRNELQEFLRTQGIESGIHYPYALHQQPAYSHLGFKAKDFPVAEQLVKDILSLPMYAELTEEQIGFVSGKIRDFLK